MSSVKDSDVSLLREVSLSQRLLALGWLKTIGSTVAIALFFVGYFYVLNYPFGKVYTMPLLAIDRWTPVLGWSAWIYFSLWIYICIPTSLMAYKRELWLYLRGGLALSIIGLGIFYLLPTVVPEWNLDWAAYPTLQFLKTSDATGNACPSLHVAFSVYSALVLAGLLKIVHANRWVLASNWIWCVLIVLSTMTTKQHVFIDVVCGLFFGAFVFRLNYPRERTAP